MATVGELLKATRETYGYTLEEVSAITHINLKYLQWLENDDLGTMPEESYFLGFLAAYASFLGLHSSEVCYRLLEQYKAQRKGKKPVESTEASSPSASTHKPSSGRHAAAVDPAQLKIFAAEEIHPAPGAAAHGPKPPAEAAVKKPPHKEESPASEDTSSPQSSRPFGLYILAALILLAIIYLAFPPVKKYFTETEKTPPPAPSAISTPVPPASPPHPAPAPAAPTPAPAKPPGTSPSLLSLPLRLEARATEDTWMGVRIDSAANRQEFVLKKGERTTWWAKERFKVTVGNAGGVELLLNGKSLGPLGKHGEVIADINLTKEGRK